MTVERKVGLLDVTMAIWSVDAMVVPRAKTMVEWKAGTMVAQLGSRMVDWMAAS